LLRTEDQERARRERMRDRAEVVRVRGGARRCSGQVVSNAVCWTVGEVNSYRSQEQATCEDAIEDDDDGGCTDQSFELAGFEVSSPDGEEESVGLFVGVEDVEDSGGAGEDGDVESDGDDC
jgi:hypothetical protein